MRAEWAAGVGRRRALEALADHNGRRMAGRKAAGVVWFIHTGPEQDAPPGGTARILRAQAAADESLAGQALGSENRRQSSFSASSRNPSGTDPARPRTTEP